MKKTLSIAALTALAGACSSAPDPVPEYPLPAQAPQPYHYGEVTRDPSVQNASLWSTTPEALLSMRRAKAVGDLLTVIVDMDDQASLQNSLTRNRDASNELDIGALFGLTDLADNILPGGSTLSPAFEIDRSSTMNGGGSINRTEQIEFKLACRVVGVEPSGNLVIEGFQQTRVSNEVRYLQVLGVVRPQDITRDNSVTYDKIADARLTYVSNGEATGAVKRKSGERFLDRVVPF